VWKQGFSDYTQSNDYSFVPSSAFAGSTTMTVYLDGKLVWGTEP
jgi:endoglucanase